MLGATAALAVTPSVAAAATSAGPVHWRSSTRRAPWQRLNGAVLTSLDPNPLRRDLEVRIAQPLQQVAGFGTALSVKGARAIALLPQAAREALLASLFGDEGTALTMARLPVGANDFADSWYSYDETADDFALRNFDIAPDGDTLIPFAQAALRHRPDLAFWASPWSPPSWMKNNGHYAMAPAWPGGRPNGIRPDQIRSEGQDAFRQEARYFDAYARYFGRYVQAYGRAGIRIGVVMPQNEFNSAQPYPSCVWTPEGLARFLPYLGKEMERDGVAVFLGTLERPDAGLVDRVLADPAARAVVRGLGVQWNGKKALTALRQGHPDLPLWQSEQECGTGTNDWHYARYGWNLMKSYFQEGASAWFYWNAILPTGGMSGWGWPQNSLVTVDPVTRSWKPNHDYHVLRHLSHFVRPGAHRVAADSFLGFEDQLAFRNPDGTLVIVIGNGIADPLPVRIAIGERQLNVTLPPDSINTMVVPG